jgi:UDP-N-acetylglucosamine 2-epimerase (non-hydrolysing)
MRICNVVGARPNFMKIAPIVHEMKKRKMPHFVVHTGQHYDRQMSQVFFEELGLPSPDIFLGVGPGSHAEQTARIMMRFEQVCLEQEITLLVVGGDVNSTLACALTAAKLGIPVAHVEAGLRSFDRSMPEEINRLVTDHISDLLFTTEASANNNLNNEGIAEDLIHFVGNCMIDSLLGHLDLALQAAPWHHFGFDPGSYALLTLHRPANVDDGKALQNILQILNEISQIVPVLFPVHPRTRERLAALPLPLAPGLTVCEPLSYLSFLGLMAKARLVLTDSGGIQEETTALHIPCLTLRPCTERPVTLTTGTNRLVGTDASRIQESVTEILAGNWPTGQQPPLWDGKASARIVDILEKWSPQEP